MHAANLSPERPAGVVTAYLSNRKALVRFLRARGAGEAAEDLVQELWLKVSSADDESVAEPLNYLYRSANNLMVSNHRSIRRRELRDQIWGNLGKIDSEDNCDAAIIARQELGHAARRLRELGPRVLRIFLMFRVDGVPQRDIAEQLGVSLSTVQKDLARASRAIAELRRRIDAD